MHSIYAQKNLALGYLLIAIAAADLSCWAMSVPSLPASVLHALGTTIETSKEHTGATTTTNPPKNYDEARYKGTIVRKFFYSSRMFFFDLAMPGQGSEGEEEVIPFMYRQVSIGGFVLLFISDPWEIV